MKLYGSESKMTEIHVGNPRYIREVVPIGAAHADPLVQRLLFVEGAEEFDSHEESSALSVSVFGTFRMAAVLVGFPRPKRGRIARALKLPRNPPPRNISSNRVVLSFSALIAW